MARGALLAKGVNRAAEKLARAADRLLYHPHVAWWNDQGWLAPYERCFDKRQDLDRRFVLLQWLRTVRELRGSTAECGVYRGVGSAFICKALEGTYAAGEEHLGFDSFQGLPPPAAIDRADAAPDAPYAARAASERPWKKGDLASPLVVARQRLAPFPFCRLVQGWIPDCFASAGERAYRFLHIDVDLYQPTLDSLAYFYPQLVAGAVIVLDDYGFVTCPGARRAADEFFAARPEHVVELPTGQAIVTKK
jgi:hypothetical protein